MKNIILAIFSGILLAFSWVTYGVSLLIFIALVPLLLAEWNIRQKNVKTKRKVLLISYLTFLIWNTITTWWIWNSTKVGALFAILVNSLLMSLVFLLYHSVAKRVSQKKSLIFLIAVWICFEKFHLWWAVSWPWLNLGNVFSEDITWIQWYEYTGTFGGTLWVWLVNILFFVSILSYQKTENKKFLTLGFGKGILMISIPIIISLFIYKNYRNQGKPTQVIVLQPNIDPYLEKYALSNTEITDLFINLASKQIDNSVDFILTPETAFADNILLKNLPISYEIQTLRNFISTYPNVNFLGGIAMHDWIFDKNKTTSQSNYIPEKNIWFNDYNSAFFINNSTDSIALYHKSKLVVGVENLPYQNVLKPLLGNIMIDLGGTVALKTTQENRSVFQSNKQQRVAPVICYESIYGEFVADYVKNGAQFIGIITNDAWWGNTQGHKQLLSYARLRAIETRKSIARSANTGISAFIDQKGHITKQLAYEKRGSLKQTILLNDKQTFYVRYGDYLARIAIFVAVGLFLISINKKRISMN